MAENSQNNAQETNAGKKDEQGVNKDFATLADILRNQEGDGGSQPTVVVTGGDGSPNYVLYIGLAILGYLIYRKL